MARADIGPHAVENVMVRHRGDDLEAVDRVGKLGSGRVKTRPGGDMFWERDTTLSWTKGRPCLFDGRPIADAQIPHAGKAIDARRIPEDVVIPT